MSCYPSWGWLVLPGEEGLFKVCPLFLDLRTLVSAGAMCHLELNHFAEAVNWCDEGLQIDAKEKKLLEVRAKADKLKVGDCLHMHQIVSHATGSVWCVC